MSHPLENWSPKDQEDWLRRGFRLIFEQYPRLPYFKPYEEMLPDDKAAQFRLETIECTTGLSEKQIALLDLWLKIIREEIKRARPDLV